MKLLKFKNGDQMPAIGLGTWKSEPNEVKNAVIAAVKCGYRHIDCAAVYGNEAEVGEAFQELFQEGVVKREEIWVTSKLWNSEHEKQHVEPALQKTLDDLKLEYLDLYLVHWPVSLKHGVGFPESADDFLAPDQAPLKDTWQILEDLHEKGKIKHLGVSNFNIKKIEELLGDARVKPEMNQVEMHPYLPQNQLIKFCENQGILMTAYSPLGSRDRKIKAENEPNLFEDQVIVEIAEKHNSSPAQILISWAVNRGTAVIPKSTNPERIKQNLAAGEIELNEAEMQQIAAIDQQFRFIDGSFWTYEGTPYEQEDLWV